MDLEEIGGNGPRERTRTEQKAPWCGELNALPSRRGGAAARRTENVRSALFVRP